MSPNLRRHTPKFRGKAKSEGYYNSKGELNLEQEVQQEHMAVVI